MIKYALDTFILLPFLFAFFTGVCVFIKNPIYFRKAALFFASFIFLLSSFFAIAYNNADFSLFNLNFRYDKISGIMLFLADFICFLAIFFSKYFIKKLHRLFFAASILEVGLLNLSLLSDNVLMFLISVFWLFLLNHLLTKSFNDTKESFSGLKIDIAVFLASFVLISYGFLRYFIINDIPLDFSSCEGYFYKISEFSICLAFFGFLILSARLLNLFPFHICLNKSTNKSNTFVQMFNTLLFLMLGFSLFCRLFLSFGIYFKQFETIIALVLMFNLVYFSLVIFSKNSFIKFIIATLPLSVCCSIFPLFSYDEAGFSSYLTNAIALILSYALLFFSLSLLENKMNTSKFDELKKIPRSNKLMNFYILFPLLNLAKLPPCILFSSSVLSFVILFSQDWDGFIMEFTPYVVLAALFILSLNTYSVIYKILIEPSRKASGKFLISKSQNFVLMALCFAVLISGVALHYIFENFIDISTGAF